MWAPHPRGRVIRRPPPDFSHRRTKIKHRPAPKDLLDTVPDSRYNYKYFGIHRSDITDHLKQQVPSHAFHPSLLGETPLVARGRGPRHVKEKKRPETAPAPIVWFGRTCSDVSDWLRYRPPAHLGLDPDNKPLPHYPSTTSLVTDNKWQSKEFPTLPHVLWHWWKERPSSVPLPAKPQQVKFETLVDAVKQRVVRPRGPYTPPSTTPTPAPTPRGGPQTPCLETSCNTVQATHGEMQQSRAQTPRETPQLQGSGEQLSLRPSRDFPPRPASAASSILTPRLGTTPTLALASRPASAPHEMSSSIVVPLSPLHGKSGSMGDSPRPSPRPPSTPRHSLAGESPKSSHPLGPCGCESSPNTPRSTSTLRGSRGGETSRLPSTGKLPQVEAQNCLSDSSVSTQVPIPSHNLGASANGGTSCTTATLSKLPSPTTTSGKPPPSPQPTHPNPPHVPRQAVPHRPCGRNHAPVPSGLYIQGQGSNISRVEKKTPRTSQELSLEDMKQMSPNCFATKIVWAEKFKQHGPQHGQGLPWPLEEKKAMKAVKAY